MTPFVSHQIEPMLVTELLPYARNSRLHSEEQVGQIAASIVEFGFTNPVLIDATGGIIAGHGRVMAAKRLGMQSVPCIRLDHLSEAQRRAYVIADNKLALNAEWDEEMLRLELTDLAAMDYHVELTGFDDEEIEALLAEPKKQKQRGRDPEDTPEPPAAPKSKPGDIWVLGQHRVMCGDGTQVSAVRRLVGGGQSSAAADRPAVQRRLRREDSRRANHRERLDG